MEIHPRLQADTHCLGQVEGGVLLLHRNATLPWLILMPDSSMLDLLDLPGEQRELALSQCAALAHYIKQSLDYPRVNFGALGNVVPQLHLHVVGRRPGDACWPDPVWGRLPPGPEYSTEDLTRWRSDLASVVNLEGGVEGGLQD